MTREITVHRVFFFISTFIAALLISGSSFAAISYKVKKGDNPYTIAKKFKVSPDDIIRANAIDPDHLKPGTKITIPSKKIRKQSKVRQQETAVDKTRAHSQQNSFDHVHEGDVPAIHIVEKGDTISSLSRKYGIPIQQLTEMNALKSTRLKIGQQISIKKPEAEDYVVQRGDTVWDIAKRFDIDPDEITEINNLRIDALMPGQRILLKRPAEPSGTKPYEAILSQSHEEQQTGQESESHEHLSFGIQERLVLFAKKMLDIPYRFGGNGPLGIDCSAYVKKVYSVIGIDLPRSAREQFNEGTPIEVHDLSIGDLVFFRTYASYPSHVGIYLGNNLFIHASSKRKKVTIDSLDTPFYIKRFIGAKRLLDISARTQGSENEG
jgi:cell wall-associated NlpC family hydrolase